MKFIVTTQADVEKKKERTPEESDLLTNEAILGERIDLPDKDSDEEEEEKEERRSSGSHSTKSEDYKDIDFET